MCTAIALASSELPLEVLGQCEHEGRVHDRGGVREVRFYWQAVPAVLPVWLNGRLQVVRWGNKDRREAKLPPTGWTWQASIEEGKWAALSPQQVIIPANFAFSNGVWFKVKQGLRGLLVNDQQGRPVVFIVTQSATRYYEIMTRNEWMPALVDEVICAARLGSPSR